jgi:ParB family chromosome partitioning protein
MSTNAVTQTAGELRTIALAQIQVDTEFNPRTSTEQSQLAQLEESIGRHGVLQPVLVTPHGDERYRLIAGHRRVAAAASAGLTEIPAIVRPVPDDTAGLDLALVENMARQDLNPVEEAVAFQRLVDAGLTRKGVAQALGVSQ